MDATDGCLMVVRTLKRQSTAADPGSDVVIKIGKPRWVREGEEASCSLVTEGLFGRHPDIGGIDPLDALRNTIALAEMLLADEAKKCDLFWPSGEKYEP